MAYAQPIRQQNVNARLSTLKSTVTIQRLNRYGGTANPLGNTSKVTRETASLSNTAGPRLQHPKLNTTPWSMSYRQVRSQTHKTNKRIKRGRKG